MITPAAFVAAARSAWPELDVAESVFDQFVRERAGERPLEALRGADLYLACACVHGDPRAIELADARCIAPLAPVLRKVTDDAGAADALQIVRLRFLVERRIAEYDGTGALATWLRVAAVRIAIDAYRRSGREVPASDEPFELVGDTPSPELAAIRDTYGPAFRAAFAAGFAALTARERNLLRQHVLDGLSIDRLAALHGVHRATTARWVAQARAQLIAHVRGELIAQLSLSDAELDSLFRAVESQLAISVRLFA